MSGNTLSWIIRGCSLLLLIVLQYSAARTDLSASSVAVLLIVLGIPHGAADHLIFQARYPGQSWRVQRWKFFAFYLVLMLLYGGLWLLLPLLALLLFLGVSVYHFGQSYGIGSLASRMAWGLFVLSFPVLLHWPEARPIIERMVGSSLPPDGTLTIVLCGALVAANLLLPLLDLHADRTNRRATLRRLLDVILLTVVFMSTDLLLGFAVFFLLWHSLPAAVEQWGYLHRHRLSADVWAYGRQLLPLSLGALISLGAVYGWLAQGTVEGIDLGIVFMLVSLITLPHAFLVDRVYR
ncbi:beta-carotene 15,15'-dioxygenase [Neolewinella maritima]|uniref:Probable beta-carotene 15,15'-dioxygenase n=1 Tax=Neolewinella maritima TaxID=1383882 RepID=A0ABM9AZD8_9BACT|nr:Brp/Blh family beta-carotene 15,15'-dioxygenase [Neolewinella maritima]CAH0999961.1 beta-carotene 15,15'-dioxygenase [Neolewinella maritima]